jgi:predicted nucleic acid-binding protein
LVLDANILIRACLGVRVRALIADFANEVDFYVAEANAAEAAGYIGELATRRGLDPHICQEALLSLMEVVQVIDTPLIEGTKDEALKRIRDPADWPALALALQLECAIWTEDQDFFGTGVATLGLPRFHGQVDRSHAMTLRLSIDDQPDQDQAPVHGAAKS